MHFRLCIALLVLTGWAAADLPRKAPLSKYTTLWTNSPFTSKPPPPEPGQVANPLEDYSLTGVSPIGSGYRVTLLNKKKPEEIIVVDSDKPAGGFKIIAVTRKSGDPLGTVVRLSSGTVTGTVAFDSSMLALAAPPAANPQPNQPPGVQPLPAPQNGQPGVRQPRPRVVPPPPAAAPGSAAARPQGIRPAQPSVRPDRRR